MTLSTSYLRFSHLLIRFCAIGAYNHLLFKFTKGPFDLSMEDHMLACVGTDDSGYWAGFTQLGIPISGRRSIPNKAAFFVILAAVIIPVEVTTFNSGWSTHP